jgi:hypothetical protein
MANLQSSGIQYASASAQADNAAASASASVSDRFISELESLPFKFERPSGLMSAVEYVELLRQEGVTKTRVKELKIQTQRFFFDKPLGLREVLDFLNFNKAILRELEAKEDKSAYLHLQKIQAFTKGSWGNSSHFFNIAGYEKYNQHNNDYVGHDAQSEWVLKKADKGNAFCQIMYAN